MRIGEGEFTKFKKINAVSQGNQEKLVLLFITCRVSHISQN